MYNTLHCVSDDVTLYIVHHTTSERYKAALIYSAEINIYVGKSVMRLLSVKLSSCINNFYFTGHSVQYIESYKDQVLDFRTVKFCGLLSIVPHLYPTSH